MTKCLVTGGAGFIGSHIVAKLVENNHEVIVVDDLSTGQKGNLDSDIPIIVDSLENVDSNIFEGIDVVFHIASIAGESISLFAPDACYKRNVLGGYSVVLNSIRHDVKRIVFTSSMAVYGGHNTVPFTENMCPDPTDPYGLSKYDTEKLLKIYGEHTDLEWSILRLHNVYGPKMNLQDPYRGVIGIFLNRLLREKAPILYSGSSKEKSHVRAFTYIDDITSNIVEAAFDARYKNEIINLGSDELTKLTDLANMLTSMTDFKGEALFEPPRPTELAEAYSSHNKAAKLINYSANTSLINGLRETLTWAKEQQISQFDYEIMKTDFELENDLPKTWKERQL